MRSSPQNDCSARTETLRDAARFSEKIGPATFDALILTGGAARRLGGASKGDIDIGGITLLERALSATEGAALTICVGPETSTSRPVVWTREWPAGGGPVTAIGAGLEHVTAGVVVVLAVDHPFVTRDHVRQLADKAAPAAWIADENGRAQPLVAAYVVAELTERLATIGDPGSVPMRRLIDGMRHVVVEDALAARDCDTWDAVEWARSGSRARETYEIRSAPQ